MVGVPPTDAILLIIHNYVSFWPIEFMKEHEQFDKLCSCYCVSATCLLLFFDNLLLYVLMLSYSEHQVLDFQAFTLGYSLRQYKASRVV